MSAPTLPAVRLLPRALAAAVLLLGAASAQAHAVLDQPRADSGSAYRAAVRITHGCEGSPTVAVTVRVPEGLRGARPVPKPGWTLSLRRAPLAQPYESHGRRITEGVVEVTWTAATPEARLDDAWTDEFVLRGQLVAPPGPLWFDVLQVCERGRWDWVERPAPGREPRDTRGLRAPSPLLEVLAPAAAGAHTH